METTVKKLNDHIYIIDQEMVRCFLVIGSREALVIDAGAFDFDLASCVAKLTDLPLKLCLTHTDGDHIKNMQQFDCIYLHEDEIACLPEDKKEKCITIKQGFVFDLGDRKLEVIHAPGHTPGSICLLDWENHELFSGDTISLGPVYMFGKYRDLSRLIDTLQYFDNLASKENWKIYPAHNECPIHTDIIAELIVCAKGVQNHTLQGEPTNISGSDGYSPLLYRYGKVGIYQ